MRQDMLRASSNEWASLPLLRRMIDPAEEKLKGEIMLSSITRARVIQVWLGALAVVVVAAVAFGATVTAGLAGVVLTLSIVPPLVVFLLWPEAQSLTAGDVLRGTDRRR